MAKSKMSQNTILAIAGIGLVAAIIIVFILRSSVVSVDPKGNGVSISERYASVQNFSCIPIDSWTYFENANGDIQELTPNQVMSSKVVYDPTQEEIAYFLAEAPDPDDNEKTLLSVYKYNTSDYTFERIYRKTFENTVNDEATDYRFSISGYDQGKLAILISTVTDGDPILEQKSLNLSNPFAKGLEPYEIPDDAMKDVRPENSCLPTY